MTTAKSQQQIDNSRMVRVERQQQNDNKLNNNQQNDNKLNNDQQNGNQQNDKQQSDNNKMTTVE